MNIINSLIIFFFIKLCSSQNILQLMAKDSSISKFYNLLLDNPTFKSQSSRDYLVILAPSNNAYLYAPDINKYIFESRTSNSQPMTGVIASWSQYTSIQTTTEKVYYITNLAGNSPLYITNLTTLPPIINGAQVIAADKTLGTQVYHVIDRMLPESYMLDFISLMGQNKTFSQTYSKWQLLQDAYVKGSLKNSSFRNEHLIFGNDKPGTILVPTNEAWTSLASDVTTKLTDPNQLVQVMARLYIPNRIMFFHNKPQAFRAGFSSNPAVDDANNFDGRYYRSSQSDIINVQGFVASVITPNIVFKGGVIHIIGSTMAVAENRNSYLQRRAPAFFNAVSGNPELNNAMAAGNITVLAMDDSSMALINQLDTDTKKQMLMNCILPTMVTIANSNNIYLPTAGNSTIVRIKVVGPRIYVDTVASMAEKTFSNRAIIMSSDDTVDGININIIKGTIGSRQFSCADMFKILERPGYGSLITSLAVPINFGSPYTIFAPSDSILSPLFNINLNATSTYGSNVTTSSSNNVPTVPSVPSNVSTRNYSTTYSGSSTTSATMPGTGSPVISPNSGNNAYQRYLLQRMIVANTLILGLRSSGQFKAATMNYAAMQEMIDISINENSQMSIIYSGVTVAGPALDDGFYCQSEEATMPNGRNLIYPMDGMLTTSQDTTIKICVTAPCTGTMVTYVALLLLSLNCVTYLYAYAL